MNCPSRTDDAFEHDGWNQSPPALAGDLTTREDLNGIANLRVEQNPMSLAERNQNATSDLQLGNQAEKGRGKCTNAFAPSNPELPDRSKMSPK